MYVSPGLFSVVVALYGVEKYVDVFFKSLERQSFPMDQLDIIVVDDESTDSSYEKTKVWAKKYPHIIRHTTKKNGGPASARNVGLEMARNEWVTFCDPDDALQSDYFSTVADFIKRDNEKGAAMLTTRVMIWQEESGKVSDSHPLGRKYFFGDRLIDLNRNPNYIQLGGASIFMRTEVLNRHSLRFDTRIRPTFEDGEFIGRYMGHFARPVVGIVSGARYLYRKRGDGSSLVQSGWGHPERYDQVLRYGYLGMFKFLKSELGYVPRWAQNMVLYDLQWYLTEDKKMNSTTAWVKGEELETFHHLLMQVFAFIDRESIDQFNAVPLSWVTRESMLTRYKGQGFIPTRVFKWSAIGQDPTQIVYIHAGRQAVERFEMDGVVVYPILSKSTSHNYFGQTFMTERSVFLAGSGDVSVWLDGEFIQFKSPKRTGWTKPVLLKELSLSSDRTVTHTESKFVGKIVHSAGIKKVSTPLSKAAKLGRKLESRIAIEKIVSDSGTIKAGTRVARRVMKRKVAQILLGRQEKLDLETVAWATSKSNATKYLNAWVVMDRPGQADDNGEHFYRFLIREHPEINAWFMLSKSSLDWARLEAEGFSLVAYGSHEAIALSLAAKFQISSDATHGVQYPIDQKRFGKLNSKIIFLQHGIIKDDLSRWLNPKDISMLVTSTRAEYESIAADNSPYKFSSKETKLTGLPRYDVLRSKATQNPSSSKEFLLVMPTWRQNLKSILEVCSTDAERIEAFSTSDYGQRWLAFLNSAQLRDIAERSGLKIAFLPHPSMSAFIDGLDIPDYVVVVRNTSGGLQDVLVRTKCLVTDYSSIFFDLAYIGVPVLHYQFDAGEIFDGGHDYRKGYFNYEMDGLGTVTYELHQLISELEDLASSEFKRPPIYEERAANTFAFNDSNNSQRVYEAILEIDS